jgi:hypothetical protein
MRLTEQILNSISLLTLLAGLLLLPGCQTVPSGPPAADSLSGRWESERTRHWDRTGIEGSGVTYYHFVVESTSEGLRLRAFPEWEDTRQGLVSGLSGMLGVMAALGGSRSPEVSLVQQWDPESASLEAVETSRYRDGATGTRVVSIVFESPRRGTLFFEDADSDAGLRVTRKGRVPPP